MRQCVREQKKNFQHILPKMQTAFVWIVSQHVTTKNMKEGNN